MPFCKICGEYHTEDEMTAEEICVFCGDTIIHNGIEGKDEIEKDKVI
jgi:hypothetical protein